MVINGFMAGALECWSYDIRKKRALIPVCSSPRDQLESWNAARSVTDTHQVAQVPEGEIGSLIRALSALNSCPRWLSGTVYFLSRKGKAQTPHS